MTHLRRCAAAVLALAVVLHPRSDVLGGDPPPAAAPAVSEPPAALRARLGLSPFYRKHVDAHGFPVVASARVSDAALLEAMRIVDAMLATRGDVRDAIVASKVRLAVMAPTEVTTDVPEHSDLVPKEYWDRRARGLGATSARPAVSCAEENLLHLHGDRYPNENILVHEFAHAIHQMGLDRIEPDFDVRLRAVYGRAMKKSLWKETYAATDHFEYWAEGVQSYFDANDANNREHNDVDSREKLAAYDPELFGLVDATFRKTTWRYARTDRSKAPAETWPHPAEEKGAKAVESEFSTAIEFRNASESRVRIHWLDFRGARVLYHVLDPGESRRQDTFLTHPWLVADERDAPWGIYWPDAQLRTVEIRRPAK